MSVRYDAVIVGSGVSGSFMAKELTSAGLKCVMLEAGDHFTKETFPTAEVDANSRLYWAGGIEFDTRARLGILRPKAVGGGSIVNQALVDRFDEEAFRAWREQSGVPFFSSEEMASWYEAAESEIAVQTIPREFFNRNATLFEEGFEKNGFFCAPLRRAQKDCRWQDGNDCILCLNGCRIDSKQSMLVTTLKKALEAGLVLVSGREAEHVDIKADGVKVTARGKDGRVETYEGKRLVLASGAVGNVRLLLRSGYGEKFPHLGRDFYCHPQYMTFAAYKDPVNSHRGPFQGLKSDDSNFRRAGFKLENVFAPPVAVAVLLPFKGEEHHRMMARMNHLACIEVAIRDTAPGRITVDKTGKTVIDKKLNGEDEKRRDAGLEAVDRIFHSTGALRILRGTFPICLHLMGGCGMGTDGGKSVVDPEFRLHGMKNVFVADSSIFPNAPGLNPSLTIMALSKRAAAGLVKGAA